MAFNNFFIMIGVGIYVLSRQAFVIVGREISEARAIFVALSHDDLAIF